MERINSQTELSELSEDNPVTFETETTGLGVDIETPVSGRVIDVDVKRGECFGAYQKTTITIISDDDTRYQLERTVSETHRGPIDVTMEGWTPEPVNCGTIAS